MRFPKLNHGRRSGFTLMEMILVLGLLGLLAGLTTPALRGVRDWLAVRESHLVFMEVETACRLYRVEHGHWPEALTRGEVRLDADRVDWRSALGLYMERPVMDELLVDGRGNTDIRLVLDADGDHWIEGNDLSGLPEADRPQRLWARVALYSLDDHGNLSATSWEME
jgi:prepilin-type N-terminal cleavage/methylation domain-containing protein